MEQSPTPPASKAFWKRWLGRLCLAFGGVAIGLLLCELILRLFLPSYSPLFLDIYRLDEHGLLALKPDCVRRHVTKEWHVTVATNSEGLRDRTEPVPQQGGTVLALGDSFAFGWGVELPDTFLYAAEETLRPEAIRVVKAGMPGTGTSDQALWLRWYGDRYRPDLVIVTFFVGNDFVDVEMGGTAGQFTIEDGLMVRRSLTTPSWWERTGSRLKRSSLLAQRMAEFAYTHGEGKHSASDTTENPGLRDADPWMAEFFKVHLRTPPPKTAHAVERTLQALDDIREWCHQHTIPMLLVVFPRSFQIYEWELAQWRKAFRWGEDQIDLDRPQRLLADWASARDVSVVDLLPAFRSHHNSRPDERLYFYPDCHLNEKGHRLVGEQLAEPIRRLLRSTHKGTVSSSAAG